METPTKQARLGSLIVFLSSLLWAGDGPFRKPLLVGGLSVPFVSFLEHLISSIASLPGLFRQRGEWKKLTKLQIFGLIYIGAGASALGALLFVQSAVVMNYNFTVAALLQKLQPIFAIVLAVLFLKEKLHPKFWFFALPALVGAYLVTFGLASPAALFYSGGSLNLLGPALAVLAAILWAGGTVVGRSLLKNLNFEFVNGARFIFGLGFLFLFMLATKGFEFNLMTPFFWRNVIIISLVTGFFALLLYYYGLKGTKASVATLMELGYPLALTAVNWKFLGITLNVWQIVGAVILLAAVTFLVLADNNNDSQILESEKGV
ncbi:MAG: EamA family transporter [Candidatus Doudnabacteria bacterium]|nr:EamA family transporter [Candidatus Doudnabacteria bacterium]